MKTHDTLRRMMESEHVGSHPFLWSLSRTASHLIRALFYFNEYHPENVPVRRHSHMTQRKCVYSYLIAEHACVCVCVCGGLSLNIVKL